MSTQGTVHTRQTRMDPVQSFQLAWQYHVDWAVSKDMVYYSMPRTVTSRFVVELLAYLHRKPRESRYSYQMARVLGHDHPNLIRRMRRWEQLGIVTSEVVRPGVGGGKPHRYFDLTKRGQRLGQMARAAKDSPQWTDWTPGDTDA